MKNDCILVSVILPAYNTEESLKIVLDAFEQQNYDMSKFEIIVIDDGSAKCQLAEEDLCKWSYELKVIRQVNKGRAAARNIGCSLARGKYIIFCDADRFPNPNLIKDFMKKINGKEFMVCVGNPLDCFSGKNIYKDNKILNWDKIRKFSRESNYFSNIANLYDENGMTTSAISWASFLVGTSCLSKKMFETVGGFDEKFTEWGFEHYDLGIKLFQNNCQFICLRENTTFHIPHKRENGFYLEKMKESAKILSENHPDLSLEAFYKYIQGKISLQDFEKASTGSISKSILDKEPLYIKITNF